MTLKKSLISSELPVLAAIEDAKVGQDVDAVVSRVRENGAIVELFGGLKAFVPIGEVSCVAATVYSSLLSLTSTRQ